MDALELYNQRMMMSNKKLLEAYEALDLTKPEDWEKLKTLVGMHQQVVKDIELQLNDDRKVDELAIEESKVKEIERANRKREKIDITGQVVAVGTAVLSAATGVWMFRRSTAKEANDAILTTTDQTVVRSGLANIFRRR